MSEDDPYYLDRFVGAQDGVFDTAIEELEAGRKRTHWMWFIFPQLKGLGTSTMAQVYGLGSLEEAQAYLAHPILGPRLRRTTGCVMDCPASSLNALFGAPDDLKFRSCVTLFDAVEPEGAFKAALKRWCGGKPDQRTLALLAKLKASPLGQSI